MESDTSYQDSIIRDLDEIDSLNMISQGLRKAINSRDYLGCKDLGLSLNQYLYLVSPRYRSKLCNLLAA